MRISSGHRRASVQEVEETLDQANAAGRDALRAIRWSRVAVALSALTLALEVIHWLV